VERDVAQTQLVDLKVPLGCDRGDDQLEEHQTVDLTEVWR
jgi:hypothetical protein